MKKDTRLEEIWTFECPRPRRRQKKNVGNVFMEISTSFNESVSDGGGFVISLTFILPCSLYIGMFWPSSIILV
jgi:hypothetical protein